MADSDRDIALVRSRVIDGRALELSAQLGEVVGHSNVYVVLDDMAGEGSDRSHPIKDAPFQILPITRATLETMDLNYEGPRTGWKCGDYVLYRALSEEWRNAWVVETDVHLLNGAQSLLSDPRFDEDVDLACLNYREADAKWYWADSFWQWVPGQKVASMAFPIFRVSRSLANAALALRKEIYSRGDLHKLERPNDESILASAARNGDFAVVDLREGRKSWFDYFSTVLKYHPPSIAAKRFDPLVVHSGVEAPEVVAVVRSEVRKVLDGDRTASSRLYAVASNLSPDLLRLVFTTAVEEACELSRKRRGLPLEGVPGEGHLR
ncbi:hypothetical protein [Brachybacterium sp. AOP24-D1-21]|uniref:hypothetical protein n=1 Tax=Brachybacterium sp. AOP24-D1-21 TaxID=3457711 RepID=UPI004034F436